MKNYKSLFADLVSKCSREAQPRAVLEAHISNDCVDHGLETTGGKEELLAYLDRVFTDRNLRELQVVRAFQEGALLFLHLHLVTNDGTSQKVSTNFFKLDDLGLVIEHWGVVQMDSVRNLSGRSKIDGPTQPRDFDKTETNKALAEEFMDQCVIGRDTASMPDYVNVDYFIEHSGDFEDDWETFQTFYNRDDCPLRYQGRVLSVAEGDFVAVLSDATYEGKPLRMVDIFRMKHDQIVEHWDNSAPFERIGDDVLAEAV